jgi:hypothetical protein
MRWCASAAVAAGLGESLDEREWELPWQKDEE